jgi:hypothetical protein
LHRGFLGEERQEDVFKSRLVGNLNDQYHHQVKQGCDISSTLRLPRGHRHRFVIVVMPPVAKSAARHQFDSVSCSSASLSPCCRFRRLLERTKERDNSIILTHNLLLATTTRYPNYSVSNSLKSSLCLESADTLFVGIVIVVVSPIKSAQKFIPSTFRLPC